MKSTLAVPLSLAGSVAALFFFQVDFVSSQLSFGGGGTQFRASDPGVRGGAAGAGGQLEGLSGTQAAFFTAGAAEFAEEDNVPDGLGPRMNLDSCGGGHHQPPPRRTSPVLDPPGALPGQGGGPHPGPPVGSPHGPGREGRLVLHPGGTGHG